MTARRNARSARIAHQGCRLTEARKTPRGGHPDIRRGARPTTSPCTPFKARLASTDTRRGIPKTLPGARLVARRIDRRPAQCLTRLSIRQSVRRPVHPSVHRPDRRMLYPRCLPPCAAGRIVVTRPRACLRTILAQRQLLDPDPPNTESVSPNTEAHLTDGRMRAQRQCRCAYRRRQAGRIWCGLIRCPRWI